MFEEFAIGISFSPYPVSKEFLVAFLAWLEVSSRITEMSICLAAVTRKHKVRNLKNPIKSDSVCLIIEGVVAQ
ncbi:10625_t:CDS:1, partial [Dentiscutata erythropus]